MSSVASSVRGVPNRFAYSATKAAVIGLTRAIAADVAAYGVRFNAICPGTVRTASLAERVAANNGDLDQAWKAYESRQPMGRLGEPKEIAALAVYLASDESAFTTGAIHVIDGGWTNWRTVEENRSTIAGTRTGDGTKATVFLKEGDVMELEIEKLGRQRQRAVSFRR